MRNELSKHYCIHDMNNPTYPVVQFLVARGKVVSQVLSLLVFLASIAWALSGGSVWVAVGGAIVSGVLLGLLLSYVEVLRIIADTLLPKY